MDIYTLWEDQLLDWLNYDTQWEALLPENGGPFWVACLLMKYWMEALNMTEHRSWLYVGYSKEGAHGKNGT